METAETTVDSTKDAGAVSMSPPPSCSVPDGWKLVPIEPTPEMIDAACCGWVIRDREMRKRLKIYRAMIAAAPNYGVTGVGGVP
jgi:hypothetical protein